MLRSIAKYVSTYLSFNILNKVIFLNKMFRYLRLDNNRGLIRTNLNSLIYNRRVRAIEWIF